MVSRVVTRDYEVEERMTIDVLVHSNGDIVHTDWALNEAAVQKVSPERMLEVVLEIDGRPVTGFGCDGIVCATPTGSTAYAFGGRARRLARGGGAADGPDQRPRPVRQALVTSPTSVLAVEVQPQHPARGAVVRRAPDRGAARRSAGRGAARGGARTAGAAAPGLVHGPARGEVRAACVGVAGRAALTGTAAFDGPRGPRDARERSGE
ncbi:NAD kinase [Streptomyces hirsutus]